MALVLVIDGLTAPGDAPWARWLPNLQRLAQVGKQGTLALPQGRFLPESLVPWMERLGIGYGEQPPSTAWFSAYHGRAAEPGPGSWCHLGFTHLFRKQDDLRFVSPSRTGQSREEIQQIGHLLTSFLAHEGWSVCYQDQEGLVIHTESPWQSRSLSMRVVEGASAGEIMPTGDDGKRLQNFSMALQLALARNPVNEARKAANRLPLNTPWFWGMGGAPDAAAAQRWQGAWLLSSDVAVLGMGKWCGWQTKALPEDESNWRWDRDVEPYLKLARGEDVVMHLQGPAIYARHGMDEDRKRLMALWDRTHFVALERALAAAKVDLVVVEGFPLEEQGIGTVSTASRWFYAPAGRLLRPIRLWKRWFNGGGKQVSLPWSKLYQEWR
ncbi:hypothetical protein Mmc1_1757 [Magnetococcus marinus MC-1]|uniref:Type I phosphodiesterase/nucleotide pyrophosphatase n=1 Tax=Magnetococcus marinus (strain ATCC BAA-1437 / JCM 17883 / MC-1) TaxID=156889 RepID=A0L8H2_MAGMM|nr:hypothetical protein [Magnetococcus marinus]ABK44265.1 hypothetical protein Mmc1_1757 [Magnetococcus marinus MC-1]